MQLRVKIKPDKRIKKLLREIEGMKEDMVSRTQFKAQLDAAKDQIVSEVVAKVGPLVGDGANADFTDLSESLTNITAGVAEAVVQALGNNASSSTTTGTGSGI